MVGLGGRQINVCVNGTVWKENYCSSDCCTCVRGVLQEDVCVRVGRLGLTRHRASEKPEVGAGRLTIICVCQLSIISARGMIVSTVKRDRFEKHVDVVYHRF